MKNISIKAIFTMLRQGLPWAFVLCLLSPVAMAEMAVIVHPSNLMKAISQDDMRRIFMGRMRMYPDSTLGVEAVDLPESNPLFASFYQSVSNVTPAKLKRQRASYLFSGKGRLPRVVADEAAVKALVASNPQAIGYVPVEMVDDSVRAVGTVKP